MNFVFATRSHTFKQPRITAADLQQLFAAAHRNQLAAALVALHAGDGAHIDQRAAVDLPKALHVQSIDEFFDGGADQRLLGGGLDAGVLLVAHKKQHVFRRDHLDGHKVFSD
jgi:hypothetical protein